MTKEHRKEDFMRHFYIAKLAKARIFFPKNLETQGNLIKHCCNKDLIVNCKLLKSLNSRLLEQKTSRKPKIILINC
jgi:hypothetical protein